MNSPIFQLRLFGSPSIAREDGDLLTGRAVQRHRLALLTLLVLSPARGLSRDKLMSYLWPERDAEHARQLLNQAVHTLRKALGDEVLLSSSEELRLGTCVLDADVSEFQEALAADDPERAVGLYTGPLLDGFFLSDAPEFERWAERERERLRRAYSQSLERLAHATAARGELHAAAEWWRRLAAEEPYNGRVTLRLMRALEAAGDRAGAIQHARVHTMLLREEFDAEPDAEVSSLAEQLRTEPALPGEVNPLRPVPLLLAPPAGSGDTTSAPRDAGGARRLPWPPRHPASALGLLGLALALLLVGLRPRQSPTGLPDQPRVMVTPFENRTGDASLDPIGRMAADWIAQSLARTGAVEVVATTASLSSIRDGPAALAIGSRFVARSAPAGAALVVAGAYYLQGDSLQFHAQITDARERRLLRSLQPMTSVPASPGPAVEELSRRTAAAMAVVIDTRLAAIGNLASQPTNYEAYQACLEGLTPFFASDWPAATRHFERSLRLDSTYLFPLLHIGYVRLNVGDLAAADSIVRVLNRARERMMPFELAILDLLSAYVAEDPVMSYEAARRAAVIGPGSPPHVQWGAEALRLNRPREASRILSGIDPAAAPVGGWPLYWRSLTGAYHRLGNHRQELRQARRARALYPNAAWPLLVEAEALAARGLLSELDALLLARRSLPDDRDPPLGAMMSAIGHELRVHGHLDAARDWLERAVEWYRTRPPNEQGEAAHRRELALALLATDEPGVAERMFQELAAEDPEDVSLAGVLGVLAARRGDDAKAERIAGQLEALSRPYRRGEQLLWRACIVAHREQQAAAVSLLQEAAGRGAHFEHTHFCLDPLRDYPAFHEFTRPKG